jgi:DNA-binding NtrC family response regulator
MPPKFTLLIADPNKNVREFLRRELVAEGYEVKLAKDDRELLRMLDQEVSADLLILDPDIPYSGGSEILEKLQRRKPLCPVVIHTFPSENSIEEAAKMAAAFLEKKGTNIDYLKAVVLSVLRSFYPHRFFREASQLSAETDDGQKR